METRPVGTELIHADKQLNGHDEDNGVFGYDAKAPKNGPTLMTYPTSFTAKERRK
jgi:hypothetical protein